MHSFLYSVSGIKVQLLQAVFHNFRLSVLGTFSSNIELWHLQSDSANKRSRTDTVHSDQNYFTTIPTEQMMAQITFHSLQMHAHNGGAGEQQSTVTETKHYHIIEIKSQHLSEVIYLMLVQLTNSLFM